VDREPVGVRVVAGHEVDAALHQAGEEVDVAGEPVELGDDEGGAGALGVGGGAGQLGSLAALDFLVGGEDRGVVGLGVVAGAFRGCIISLNGRPG
jgi:hypothetical protein